MFSINLNKIGVHYFQFKMWWVFNTCILLLDTAFFFQPVVEICNGLIRGQTLQSRNGRDYYSFTGIPYAKPPVGQFRFKVSNINKQNNSSELVRKRFL